jgi:hypothetical protein
MPRYPLTTVLRLRAQQVEDAAALRRARQADAENAKSGADRAEQATQAHGDAVACVNDDEAARLAQGELRAGDLVRHGAWAHVAALTTASLQKAEVSKRLVMHRAEEAVSDAASNLTRRKREADLVTKHAERWSSAAAKRREEGEADEVEDRWRSR